GHHIVMGRKTFESIGKPLPGRKTIILTRSAYDPGGCLVAHSLNAALELAQAAGEEELFVCGGSDVYAQAVPIADRLYITEVDALVDADTFFPDLDWAEWVQVTSEYVEASDNDEHGSTFKRFERKAQASPSR
ncbi:MAG TPA: dihydrofolate reductase, partial [Blastocatellia bacterium]|nr:dihydrofolate reductase [Blastocatellia bacterium]